MTPGRHAPGERKVNRMRFRTGWIGYDRKAAEQYLRLLSIEGRWLQFNIREQEKRTNAELLALVQENEELRREIEAVERDIRRLTASRDSP